MALSNIGREPRKEIGESLVGLAVFAAAFTIDWLLSGLMCAGYTPASKDDLPYAGAFFVSMCFIPIATVAIFGLLVFTHWIGERTIAWARGVWAEAAPKKR